MSGYPFIQPAFLAALEQSGSVCNSTGWSPQHLEFNGDNGQPVLLPLYEKTHSWGEYVFDWEWANAYQRHGLAYYPKLLSAIPFTPATGPRLQSNAIITDNDYLTACRLAIEHCRQNNLSGWHFLFPEMTPELTENIPELLHRTGIQYHWLNRNYQHFGDFLGQLKSRKRKMIKRERSSAHSQGLEIAMLSGDQVTPDLWHQFYHLYVMTYLKRSGTKGYLTEAFFQKVGEAMPQQIALAVATRDDQLVAASLYFRDQHSLYGRYWGCNREYEHLHFELCYYQGIEFAIEQELSRFDAGAQGEHKLARGFEPVITHSYHWINDLQFREAIARFLNTEKAHIKHWQQQAAELLPYREEAAC